MRFSSASVQFLQHQHSDPGIVAGYNSPDLRFKPVPVMDHGPKTCPSVIAMNQLKLIGIISGRSDRPVDDLHRLLPANPMQVDFYNGFTHNLYPMIHSPSVCSGSSQNLLMQCVMMYALQSFFIIQSASAYVPSAYFIFCGN